MSAFLLIFAAMLLTIDQYGVSIPFNDEWDAEALWLYKLYFEGNLELINLFEPHNGHRIFMTRLTALILFVLNGGWDPQLQMLVNGLLHALTGAILVGLVQRQIRGKYECWVVLATILLFAIPFSWLSILVAFQTQFYFMVFFSVLALLSLSSERYIAGYSFAALSMLSITSGAFVLPAFVAIILIESYQNRSITQSQIKHIIVCGVIFSIFVVTLANDPASEVYYAQHLSGFVVTILATVSWPFRVSYGIGMIIYVPLGLLILRAFFVGKVPRFYLSIGVFIILQILAMGYFRGGEGVPPANRYWGIMIIGVWLNGMCLLLLLQDYSNKALKSFTVVWSLIATIGMSSLAFNSLTEGLPGHKKHSLTAQSLILEYLTTGENGEFDGISAYDVSYPDTERLMHILSDSTVQQILPSALGAENLDRFELFKNILFQAKWLIGIIGLCLFVIYVRPGLRLWTIPRKY